METNNIKVAAQESAELSLHNFRLEESQLQEEQNKKRKSNQRVNGSSVSSRATSVPGLFLKTYYSNSYTSRYKLKEQNEPPTTLEENDVICGINPKSELHSGSIKFRCLVKTFRSVYPCYNTILVPERSSQSNIHQGLKHRIIKYIFKDIRSRGGRFLKLVEEDSTESWQELEDDLALEKINRALEIVAKLFIERQQERALRNFETFYSLQAGSTDILTIARTSAGVGGWANSNVTLPCSSLVTVKNSIACFGKDKVAGKRPRWDPTPIDKKTQAKAKKVKRIKKLRLERERRANEKTVKLTVTKHGNVLDEAIVQSEKNKRGSRSNSFLKDRHTEKSRTRHTVPDFESTCAHSNDSFQECEQPNNLQVGDSEKEMREGNSVPDSIWVEALHRSSKDTTATNLEQWSRVSRKTNITTGKAPSSKDEAHPTGEAEEDDVLPPKDIALKDIKTVVNKDVLCSRGGVENAIHPASRRNDSCGFSVPLGLERRSVDSTGDSNCLVQEEVTGSRSTLGVRDSGNVGAEEGTPRNLCPKKQNTDDARLENVESNLDQEYYPINSTDILVDGFIALNLSEDKRQNRTNLQSNDDSISEELSLVEIDEIF